MFKKTLFLFLIVSLYAVSAQADTTAFDMVLPESWQPPIQDAGGPAVYSIPIPNDPLIEYYIKEYTTEGGQRTMTSVLRRGAPYLGFIYNNLINAGMPPELMYLPAVESGFRAWAVSRSGAAGFWQFMMNSIGPYDMDVSEWQDDRRDFWKATESAIHKLQYNYSRTGSWTLAIAAYNCGLGRIERSVEAAGTTDYIKLYEQGYIPRETRNYVPKFFAFTHLAMHADSLGLPAASIKTSETALSSDQWERIELDQAVNLVILASKAGIPVSFLHEANAELRHGISPPASSGYFLKVPTRYSDNIKSVIESTEEPLMRFYIHEIQGGDTFYALSRHFGVSVSMIQMYNPGTDARSLRNGQKIIIPALKEAEPFRSGYDGARLWSNSEPYTIKTGDTLWGIARTFHTSVEEITFNNKMDAGDTLHAGMVIKVPREN